jgi:hypothetical protein
MNTGAMEAQRIMRERRGDTDRLARQDRDDRILRTEPPVFFETMATCVGDNTKGFNQEIGLSGDDAMTFLYTSGMIQIGKRHAPFFLRKVMLRQASNEVVIRTEKLSRTYRREVSEEVWRFDVECGELTLNGKNLIECADALFAGIADSFR